MKLKQIIFITITVLTLISCGPNLSTTSSLTVATPDIGIPLNSKYLEISAPSGWNTLKDFGTITLMIQNMSDQQIVFNQDSGIKIFVFAMGKWNEVKNKMTYSPVEITFVPYKDSDMMTTLGEAMLAPDLTGFPASSKIRIYIIGKLSGNQQNTQEIASYVDVMLNP